VSDKSPLATWKQVRYGDVVRKVSDRADPESSGLTRYVAGEHMDTDDLRVRRWGTIGEGYLGPAFNMRFKPGSVLYGSRRTYLRKVAVPDFEGICANTTFVLEPKSSDLSAEFLPLVMSTDAFHAHSIQQSKGSVNPYINFSDLTWYEFALPPLDEQKSIVELVAAADAVVEAWEVGLSAATAVADAVLNEVPLSPTLTLGDVLDESPRSGLTIKPTEANTGVRALTIGSAGEFGYSPAGMKSIDNSDLRDCEVKAGDLFVTRSNTIARVGYPFRYSGGDDGVVVYSDLLFRLRLRPSTISPAILEAYLRSPRARRFIRSIAAGTSDSMKKINAGNLKRLPLPDLGGTQQAVLEATVDAQSALVLEARDRLRIAQKLRATLIVRLLSQGVDRVIQ